MYLVPWIWAAGALHLLVASANFFAARKLRFADNLRRLTPIVRDVFIVQNVFIVLLLAAIALLCFVFAGDLAGPTTLGRCLSAFLALFWGLRLLIQLFFYNAESKRQYPVVNAVLLMMFIYLCGVFTFAALGWGS
jgi:alginate O-acetyltransferase complex protein AlgI